MGSAFAFHGQNSQEKGLYHDTVVYGHNPLGSVRLVGELLQ